MDVRHGQLLKNLKHSLINHFKDPKTLTVLRDPHPVPDFQDLDRLRGDISPDNYSRYHVPPLFQEETDQICEFFMESTFDNGPFDLVFGDIPIGLKVNLHNVMNLDDGRQPLSNSSWELIFQYSRLLSDDGVGVFVMTPGGFNSGQGRVFLEYLNSRNLFVTCYLNLPDRIFQPLTGIRPILIVVRRQNDETKVCDLELVSDFDGLVEELLDNTRPSHWLKKLGPLNQFKGFGVLQVQDQISRLESRYKDYKTVPLMDLLDTYHRGRPGGSFEDIPNCVYLKILGSNTSVFVDKEDLKGRIENYIQLVFKNSTLGGYTKVFFESDLGQLCLKSLTTQGTFNRLSWRDLLETGIPVPNETVQVQILETVNRFNLIEEHITKLRTQISLNPESLSLLSKIDSIMEITESLTEGDKIKSLVLQGESKSLEFKQTFDLCLREKTRQKYVEDSCLKTIVGFLNTDGGILLIGVEDSGMIPGIDHERSKCHKDSNDKYLLHVKNKISSRIGKPFFRYIDTLMVDVDGKTVVEVLCKPSDEEVFLDEKDFYIRTSPSTDKLEGKDLSTYLKSRFTK